jgi:hypothetical protein
MLVVSNLWTYFDLCWESETHGLWGLSLLSKKTTFLKKTRVTKQVHPTYCEWSYEVTFTKNTLALLLTKILGHLSHEKTFHWVVNDVFVYVSIQDPTSRTRFHTIAQTLRHSSWSTVHLLTPPVNLICVVGTTLSSVTLSVAKGIHTSVAVVYLLYLGRYKYCGGDVPG